MGGILIHLIPNPWLVGPSSASPSSPRLTSTGTPTPSTLSEHWVWCREGCGQVCTEQSQGKHGKCHPSQAGRAQHVTWEIQGLQAPPSPVQVLCGSWCGGCHLRGLSICLWLRWQAQEKGRYLAQVPHSNLSLNYFFSGWWEGVPGSGWITESQDRVSRHLWGPALALLISPCQREALHSKNQTSWQVRETAEKGKSLILGGHYFSYFWIKISTFLFCPTLQIMQPVL